MKGWLGILLVLCVLPVARGSAGEQSTSAYHGSHWAHVSDRAQIELIVDELQSHTATPGAVSISIAGMNAVVSSGKGDRLELEKRAGIWRVRDTEKPAPPAGTGHPVPVRQAGVSVGATFTPEPVSREFAIDRLTRDVTQSRLNRALFSTPEKTAAWYRAHYTASAPFVQATYVQFVTDPGWGRIVYGNMNRWIRTLPVSGPSAIAVDPDGRVFIGEQAGNSLAVYRLTGEGDGMQLQFAWRMENVTVTDLALDDQGTPLATGDDVLYVADAVHNRVDRYAVGPASASRTASWSGFDSPTVLTVGKRNGASNGILYVVDHIGKRIRSFDPGGGRLTQLALYTAGNDRYIKSLKVDHFGGVYAVDNTRNELLKFTPSLDVLDVAGDGEFDALAAVEIPFGRIEIDGEPPVWAGFDQLFAVERWSPRGGAQRRTLGIRLRDIAFSADEDRAAVDNTFTMTDAASVSIRVTQENGSRVVRTLASSWMVAGGKTIVWDRRDDQGRYVAPGVYRYEIVARSPYRDAVTTSYSALSLPLYYHEDCGSAVAADDPHVVRGRAVRWGALPSESSTQDAQTVLYRFAGLNPRGSYEIAAEFGANDGEERTQTLLVNGRMLVEPIRLRDQPVQTGYVRIPAGSIVDGEMTVAVERVDGPNASVTQLWLKESGQGVSAEPVNPSLPTSYVLEQNYPNPFNPATTIRFSIPEAGPVTLKVYTITGQEVTTLVNENREAGTYAIVFDTGREGKNLSSGVYFYRLTAGNFTAAKKFVLLK
jgi:hypothetical protein